MRSVNSAIDTAAEGGSAGAGPARDGSTEDNPATDGSAKGDPAGDGHAEDGWPDRPGDTALTVRVPEADPLVRVRVPAHVTVLYPFLHASRLTPGVHAELTALFAARAPFRVRFERFRRYPGVLYLPPSPDEPFRLLTDALTRRWPEAVPYRGLFGTGGLDPHLTVANDEGPETYEKAYDALEARLAPRLPLTAYVTSVRLIETDGTTWHDRWRYDLGTTAP